MIMKYSKVPNACKSFIAFMMDAEQFDKWLIDSVAYLTHPLNAYDANPVWRSDPKLSMLRDVAKRTLTAGGLGSVGEKAAVGAGRLHRARHGGLGVHRPRVDQGGDRGRRAAGQAHLPLSGQIALGDGDAQMFKQLVHDRNFLGALFMLPAAAFLLLFLVYPLGLGIWLSFTDAKIGTPGEFVGLENYEWIIGDCKFQTAVFFTIFYTVVASVIKFAIGLYLALLLNQHLPFKAIIRAVVLIPFIVPTVLSAIAFWWIFDPQFSIVSWSLRQLGLINGNINFLGDAWNARYSVIFANVWRGVPFIAITLLAGLQTVPPSLYEAATLDGATRWQMFVKITYPLLTPIIAVVMTFSVLFTFTDFQLIKVLTNGGPAGATELMATMSYNTAILGGRIGEGAAISTAMVPFLLAAILVSWFGLQRRKWQQGEDDD